MRRRAIAHGRVQGVFFRDSVARLARGQDVRGWIRNLPEGTVEAVFEGRPDAVERLIEYCRTGPADAEVSKLEVHEEEPEGLSDFHVR